MNQKFAMLVDANHNPIGHVELCDSVYRGVLAGLSFTAPRTRLLTAAREVHPDVASVVFVAEPVWQFAGAVIC